MIQTCGFIVRVCVEVDGSVYWVVVRGIGSEVGIGTGYEVDSGIGDEVGEWIKL